MRILPDIEVITIVTISLGFLQLTSGTGNHMGNNGNNGVGPFQNIANRATYGECTSTVGYGTCMRRADCLQAGGETPPGDCTKGTYCCTAFIGCGETAQLKRVYIEREDIFEMTCNHNIIMINENICQLRLDFEEFELAPPTDVGGQPLCLVDNFQVKDFELCGVNDGQHVYVDVTPGTQLNVELNFNLMDRAVNPGLVNPRWRILVTQIECPPGAAAAARTGRDLIDSYPEEEIVRDSRVYHNTPPAYVLDQAIRAPRGCLQYFPNRSGVIESFNFQHGIGTYPGNMNYAICFKRRPNDKRITFTSHFFQLGFTILSADNEGYDNICYTPIESPGRSEDYLFIPQAIRQTFPNVRASYFCAQSLANTSVIAAQTGPFVIHFNSDSLYEPQRPEIGFRMSYQIS